MNRKPSWTLEQAAELFLEQLATLLEDADSDDTVRPALVFRALAEAWAPARADVAEAGYALTAAALGDLPELTVAELRRRIARARADLARGERIP